jgi:hypothetical protein
MREARLGTPGPWVGPSRKPAGAFALLVGIGGALLAGTLYFFLIYAPAERTQVVQAWEARLHAMADDRRAAISAWVASGVSDAVTVASFPTVVALTGEHAGGRRAASEQGDPTGHLQGVIDGFVRAHDYRALYIVDRTGAIVARSSRGAEAGGGCLTAARRLAMEGKSFADFCTGPDGRALVVFGGAILGGGPPSGDSARIGVTVIEVDPALVVSPTGT